MIFDVNNKGIMKLEQNEHDGSISLSVVRENKTDSLETIFPGDMVMLMNYYKYQKEHNLPIF